MNKFTELFRDIKPIHTQFLKNLYAILQYISYLHNEIEENCSEEISYNDNLQRKFNEYKRDVCIIKSRNQKINSIYESLKEITLELKNSPEINQGKAEHWMDIYKKYQSNRNDFEKWLNKYLDKCTLLERMIINKYD